MCPPPTSTAMSEGFRLVVAGRITDARFQQARVNAEHLVKKHPEIHLDLFELLPSDFDDWAKKTAKTIGPDAMLKAKSPIVVKEQDGSPQFLGNLDEFLGWLQSEYGETDNTFRALYKNMARQRLRAYMESTNYTYCFFDVSVDEQPIGRISFELFSDVCPNTCDNFARLCDGVSGVGGYKDSAIHRIIPDGFIQGGDIDGKGGNGADGELFADESFAVKHGGPGILSMATSATHSNGSQFIITTQAIPSFDGKCVAFGRVMDGMRVVKAIEKLETANEKPIVSVQIHRTGHLL